MKLNKFLEVDCCLEFRPKTLEGIGLGGFAASDGVGWEKSVRLPSTIGPKLLFASHEAFELVPKPNLHSTYALSQQTLNPKP